MSKILFTESLASTDKNKGLSALVGPGLDSRITTAQNAANTGVSNAATAQSAANNAQSTANGAVTAAGNAQTTANAAAAAASAAQDSSDNGLNTLGITVETNRKRVLTGQWLPIDGHFYLDQWMLGYQIVLDASEASLGCKLRILGESGDLVGGAPSGQSGKIWQAGDFVDVYIREFGSEPEIQNGEEIGEVQGLTHGLWSTGDSFRIVFVSNVNYIITNIHRYVP